MATFESRLSEVVGAKTAKGLETALGLQTVGDLLRHYPRRLVERGELTDMAQLREGDDVTVMAEVARTKQLYNRGAGKRLEVVVHDSRRNEMILTFFSRSQGGNWLLLKIEKELSPGTIGMFAGTVSRFRGQWQLTHPEYQLFDAEDTDPADPGRFAGALIPIYPVGKRLKTWTVANAVRVALDVLDPVQEPLPAEVRARHGLMDLDRAFRSRHLPETRDQWYAARKRLAFDEALAIQVVLAQRRAAASADPATARPGRTGGILDAFDARLPFDLTDGQRWNGDIIAEELAGAHPMHRLLQGEVGSGKTVVALRAMLQVVDSGGQAALLAPTEVLATQHARTIEAMLGPLGQGGRLGGAENATRIALLTGSLNASARKEALLDAAGGAAGIVIGTHALIQDQVQFADLGLVVVDEQHRFGVEQRDALRAKAQRPPHLLVMTATPIPRTVAMTVFGDLDTSTLTELPRGRSPIKSAVVPTADKPQWLATAWQRIREQVEAGHQAYVVCPRISADVEEEPDAYDAAFDSHRRPPLAVDEVMPMLVEGPLAGLRIAALHGRLHPDEKDRVMTEFAAGRLDVLVSTTVIEVGVDVPNATVMVVMDAERFGISQLHQLRGRIGRGRAPGLCLLVSDVPAGTPARERLDAVAATGDGFQLARLDLEQRREGDVLGVAQSGRRSKLKVLSLIKDEDLIVAARTEAVQLVAQDPTLASYPGLAQQVAELVESERADYLEKA